MAYYNDGKVFRNLPEQVEKNKDDIESIQTAQKTDESNINTNLNNINAHETRINALESIKMTQDGQNIKLIKSTGEIGNIAVGTVGGTNLLGGNDVTFKTINGEAITGDGNLVVDADLSTQLWAELGISRFENTKILNYPWEASTFVDILSTKYTSLVKYLNGAEGVNKQTGNYQLLDNINMPDFNTASTNCTWLFNNFSGFKKITLGNLHIGNSSYNVFSHIKDLEEIAIADGKEVYVSGYSANTFYDCPNLTTIGAINMNGMHLDGAVHGIHMFNGCPKLKTINCTHWRKSFNISTSTAFEQADLVNIISNLDTISDNQVLTMGTTNLNKLTTDQIAVATGKGWTLA